jgi:predicted anti-sigma-YlaC factor YlaD
MIRLKKPNDRTDHGYFEERLSAYLDGELVPQEQKAIEHHLDGCQICQWNLDTLQQTVQWTRELQPLTVPRVFTISAPAEPERSARRRWNLTPLLQGATALVALLLFFAVAGDFWLGSLREATVPDAWTEQEAAPARAATDVALGSAPAAEPVVEATALVEVVETVEVEVIVEVEPVTAPLAQTAPETDAVAKASVTAPNATAREGIVAAEAPPEEAGEQAEEMPIAQIEQADEGSPEALPEEVVGAGGPTPETEATSLAQLAAPSEEEVLAQTEESESLALDDHESARSSGQEWLAHNWLRLVEYALGGLFLVLFVTSLVVTVRKRKAR